MQIVLEGVKMEIREHPEWPEWRQITWYGENGSYLDRVTVTPVRAAQLLDTWRAVGQEVA